MIIFRIKIKQISHKHPHAIRLVMLVVSNVVPVKSNSSELIKTHQVTVRGPCVASWFLTMKPFFSIANKP